MADRRDSEPVQPIGDGGASGTAPFIIMVLYGSAWLLLAPADNGYWYTLPWQIFAIVLVIAAVVLIRRLKSPAVSLGSVLAFPVLVLLVLTGLCVPFVGPLAILTPRETPTPAPRVGATPAMTPEPGATHPPFSAAFRCATDGSSRLTLYCMPEYRSDSCLYRWDFGDQSGPTTMQPRTQGWSVSHLYASGGTYIVSLFISGATGSAEATSIEVVP